MPSDKKKGASPAVRLCRPRISQARHQATTTDRGIEGVAHRFDRGEVSAAAVELKHVDAPRFPEPGVLCVVRGVSADWVGLLLAAPWARTIISSRIGAPRAALVVSERTVPTQNTSERRMARGSFSMPARRR